MGGFVFFGGWVGGWVFSVLVGSVAATRLTLTRLAESRLKRTITPISQLVVPGNLTRPTRLKSRLVSRLMEG